jgi:Cd2+/Zn2+-exporting ATPase
LTHRIVVCIITISYVENNYCEVCMSLLFDLAEIGFTEYEAKVYLALLHNHPATGYQLSKESGVPRSMVYESLKRLHRRGAALETVEGRSTLYRPLPPDLLLDKHEAEYRRRVDTLRDGLGDLYSTTADDRVWSISGWGSVIQYATYLLGEAKEEAFLVLTDDDLEALHAEVLEACGRAVAVNTLLTGQGELNCGRVVRHPPLESELQGLTKTLLVAVDDVEVLIASTGNHLETKATVTRNSDLVLIARQFVWMELFTQRVYAQLGPDLLDRLDPEDRRIFESLTGT